MYTGKMESFYTLRTSSGKCQLCILILIHQKGEEKKSINWTTNYIEAFETLQPI